jgi:hypothetical protein
MWDKRAAYTLVWGKVKEKDRWDYVGGKIILIRIFRK